MTNERTALRLGVGHQTIHLHRNAKNNTWQNSYTSKWEEVESAALGWFMEKGWSGYAGEGGLILNLIKAMSFKKIPLRHRSTFIEALYAQNVAFEEDRYDTQVLLKNVVSASSRQVARNYDRMAGRELFSIGSGSVIFFPGLKRLHFLGLLKALGNDAIFRIAEIFATDPYKYRKGWPDLTIWQGNNVAFKEIKAPGDTLRRSQRVIIKEILLPLNFNVSIVDVSAMK